jgi:hypothetical protein
MQKNICTFRPSFIYHPSMPTLRRYFFLKHLFNQTGKKDAILLTQGIILHFGPGYMSESLINISEGIL